MTSKSQPKSYFLTFKGDTKVQWVTDKGQPLVSRLFIVQEVGGEAKQVHYHALFDTEYSKSTLDRFIKKHFTDTALKTVENKDGIERYMCKAECERSDVVVIQNDRQVSVVKRHVEYYQHRKPTRHDKPKDMGQIKDHKATIDLMRVEVEGMTNCYEIIRKLVKWRAAQVCNFQKNNFDSLVHQIIVAQSQEAEDAHYNELCEKYLWKWKQ